MAIKYIKHPTGRLVRLGGVRRDPPGHPDPKYGATKFQSDELPPFVDLRPHCTSVEDQGDLSSCTANALAGGLEYLEKRITGSEVNVSRLFIYWNERDLDGETDKDEGAVLRNGIKSLQQHGACAEDTWPYAKEAVFEKPHDGAYQEGSIHTIDEAHKVEVELHDMRHCLAEGYPFAFGLEIFKSFESDGHHGRISMPAANEKSEGGHAMLCVGYSDEDKVFLVRNSWGPKWGEQGYCYIPYDYMADPDHAHDLWTVRKAHNLDFTQGVRGVTPSPHGTRTSFFSDVASIVSGVATAVNMINQVVGPRKVVVPVGPTPSPRPQPVQVQPAQPAQPAQPDNPWATPSADTTQVDTPAVEPNPWGTMSTETQSTDPQPADPQPTESDDPQPGDDVNAQGDDTQGDDTKGDDTKGDDTQGDDVTAQADDSSTDDSSTDDSSTDDSSTDDSSTDDNSTDDNTDSTDESADNPDDKPDDDTNK